MCEQSLDVGLLMGNYIFKNFLIGGLLCLKIIEHIILKYAVMLF